MEYSFPGASIPESDLRSSASQHSHDFSCLGHSDDNMFLDSGLDDSDFAAALAQFQPCDDCTPATKTTIPHHHHHPSGRLAGASATLDGHFCCSWLIHDQPCFLCFQSAEALDNHIKNDHAGKDGTYRCLWQDCCKQDHSTNTLGPMNFGNKPKLMRHVHSHTGYKPFLCSFPGCEKGFVTKEQLKNHETTHTKSRKYKCDQCGKAFAVKSALTTHITAVHDEKKIHACDICGKAFADSSNLSKHKQTHFRDASARKQRSRRATTNTATTRSSPSNSAPSSIGPPTPIMHLTSLAQLASPPPSSSSGLMAPPAMPKFHPSGPFAPIPITYCAMSSTSTTSSPPPESSFDPDCYCCDQQCPPPNGPATPCDETDDCDLDGFCDLPDCLGDADSGDAHHHLPTVACCPETSVALTCTTCDEPLMPHQIEQLRNFQMSPPAASSWEEFVNVNVAGHHVVPAEDQFFSMHGG